MAKTHIFRLSLVILLALTAASCVRERLDDELCRQARSVTLAVAIDWSRSGINTGNLPDTDEVGRVSLRFFPMDGSPAFDCYLDTDVTSGTVDVPPGRYAVVAFNESIYDDAWWDGRIEFTDIDSYDDFAVRLMPWDDELRAQQFPWYQPRPGERVTARPLALAAWSIDELEVAPRMVSGGSRASRVAEEGPLAHIVMRRLTHRIDVTVEVENLSSARSIQGALRGLASTVRLASGRTAEPSTQLFSLNGRQYDPGGRNGTTHASFLSLGRTPPPESYQLEMEVILMDGRPHDDPGWPSVDITQQMTAPGEDSDITIRFARARPPLSGGIAVEEWGEDEQYTLN
jgi:hypothetical protein